MSRTPGMRRVIAVAGDELRVAVLRGEAPAGGFTVFARDADCLLEAIRLSHDRVIGDGRREAGELPAKGDRAHELRPAPRPAGDHRGEGARRPTLLVGDELRALERALASLARTK